MTIIKYPSENDVNTAISEKEPLLVLISFDGKTAIVSQIDEAMEHHILLAKAGFLSTDIDKYFRIVLDENGVSKLLEAIKTNGNFKYCKDSSEITLDDKAIARVIDNVCHAVQPERNIMKPKDYYSK